MLIPKNRHEYYLAVISGNDYPTFYPKTREEQYLAKLAGREVDVSNPKTPKERAYFNIINDIKFEPENRWQTFVAAANDDSITAPIPRTREEIWWANISLSHEVIVEYTGTLPATLQTVEGYLESYKIYGNTEQAGTPTPLNPIEPESCGELETTGAHAGQYKLPLTSAGQNVDIYLGEVETTRRIKKLVLTGTETMYTAGLSTTRTVVQFLVSTYFKGATTGLCNILEWKPKSSYTSSDYNRIVLANDPSTEPTRSFYLSIDNSSLPEASLNGVKTYLQQQYTNGTPVTIWYILATEETGTLNEPLRKIGDYADTIDSAQTSVQIPTAAGTTVIDYAGEGLAPSKVELTYKTIKKTYVSADDKVYQDTNGQLLGG